MKINSISPLNYINRLNGTRRVHFGASPCDSFEKSSETSAFKKITVKNLQGKEVEGTIKRKPIKKNGVEATEFTAYIKGEHHGRVIVQDSKQKDALYLSNLNTEENAKRKYKGIGSELIKCAILESKKRGYKGKIELSALYNPPPFVFYYKNNFKIAQNMKGYEGALEYAIKNNIPAENMFLSSVFALDMELSEENADKLLEGERLFEKSEFKNLTKQIGGKNYDSCLIKLADGSFALVVVNTSSEKEKLKFSAAGKIETSDDNKPYIKFYNVDDSMASDKICKFAEYSANKLAQEFGLHGGIITSEYRQ